MASLVRYALLCAAICTSGCIEFREPIPWQDAGTDGELPTDTLPPDDIEKDGGAPDADSALSDLLPEHDQRLDTTTTKDTNVDVDVDVDLDTNIDGEIEVGVDVGLDTNVDGEVDLVVPDTGPPPDVAPPLLRSLTITPTPVDVTSAAAEIMVALKATDQSEITLITVSFALTTNSSKTFYAALYPSNYNSATGAYEKTITIPRGQEPGTYELTSAYLADEVGNIARASTGDPTGAGLDIRTVAFDVINTGLVDTKAPVLTEVMITPTPVDVTSAAAEITLAVKATDESEITLITVSFALTTNSSKTFYAALYPSNYNSATGAYEKTITIPRGQEPGTYELTSAYLADEVGNIARASTVDPTGAGLDIRSVDFDVINTGLVDTKAPVLTEVIITPTPVDVTSAAAEITVAVKATDESEITLITVSFALTTNSSKTFYAALYPSNYNSATGAYEKTLAIPQGQEPGTYELTSAYLADEVGNIARASTGDPTGAGLDIRTVAFDVINGP